MVVKLGLPRSERSSGLWCSRLKHRKIFWAKRDEITGKERKLHNAVLHAFYSSPNIIKNLKSRRLRWAGHVARMEQST